jgi:hypothetical protein
MLVNPVFAHIHDDSALSLVLKLEVLSTLKVLVHLPPCIPGSVTQSGAPVVRSSGKVSKCHAA